MSESLKYIRPITWPEIMDAWREAEANQERWQQNFKKAGFPDWHAWRSNHMAPLHLTNKKWSLYKILHPAIVIPEFHGGPFASWTKKHYSGQSSRSFKYLTQLPNVQSNQTINAIIKNFPSPTTLIGLAVNEKIIIIDGMHRCCAIALAAAKGEDVKTNFQIALTDFSEENLIQLNSGKKYSK